ncbi:MAG: DUF3987 domain-containing protein [Bacteroides sp.]|uniref:DUF3987 domain-containing protein n=1 Tax=Bacteroides sp. TaxID=29523 RepID=UPI0026DF13F9|nr:DUF3987 domain-containing protein [Bacteroides sp.]MDO5420060.1 DUF3987 domain-containing protein [Bacteroides sp.]
MKSTVPTPGIIRFSRFLNVRSKCPQTITIEQFLATTRSDELKQRVLAYRLLKSQRGKEAEAQAIKNGMPCITPSAVCEGGHAVTDRRELSGILCIDLDHTGTRTEEVRKLAEELPFVVAAFISISGEGVKIFVCIRCEDTEAGYAPLYAAVGEAISQHVRHPYDEKCKTLTQPCYYSWDPQAYLNPQAVPFVYVPSPKPHSRQASPHSAATAQPSVAAGAPETRQLPASGSGFMENFIACFEQEYPFRTGQRNSIALKLGRAAARKGFSPEELEQLTALYAGRNAMPDFTERDIRQRVTTGYQFINDKIASEGKDTRAHLGLRAHHGFPQPEGEETEEEDLLEINDGLRGDMPYIPDEVFSLCPSFFLRCTENAANRRERDILLLGSLNSCSALFPHVGFFYKDRYVSPHSYLAIVAPAAAGKGALACTSALLNRTDEYYRQQNRDRQKAFDRDTLAWEEEQRHAKREKRKADIGLKPQAPVMQYFKLPATTSKSRLIESLAAAEAVGCAMVSTEIVTLTSAFNQDYGNFEDILLKCFQHEEVGSSFKIDGEPKLAASPHLAVCLSGTQEQFTSLFRSLESGLYSRFMFYTRRQELVWENCGPHNGNIDRMQHFRKLGEELFEMHRLLLQSPTLVTFTPAQWEEHTSAFAALLRKAAVDGSEATAGIVLRCGLQAMRLAATFTVFRKYADYPYAKEYVCTDDDFHAAMMIAFTTVEHARLLSSALPATLEKPRLMHKPGRMELALVSLPAKFSYTEFLEAARLQGASRATGKRWLKKAVSMQILEKQDESYRKATGSAPRGAYSEP